MREENAEGVSDECKHAAVAALAVDDVHPLLEVAANQGKVLRDELHVPRGVDHPGLRDQLELLGVGVEGGHAVGYIRHCVNAVAQSEALGNLV